MLKKILGDVFFSTVECVGFFICAHVINWRISFSDVLYYVWFPLSIMYIAVTIGREKMTNKKISPSDFETVILLMWGTAIIVSATVWTYHELLKTKPGLAFDVIPWGMVAWLALIFMTLGYAQLKKPKKEEVKKEE